MHQLCSHSPHTPSPHVAALAEIKLHYFHSILVINPMILSKNNSTAQPTCELMLSSDDRCVLFHWVTDDLFHHQF